jgi:hypothetical protein
METIPLVAHRSAATIDGRLEGLVFFTHDDGNDDVDDDSTWTAQDTANALDQCPYEEYLGLKLYMEDPLSEIRRYALTTGAAANAAFMFIDHEFPVHPQAAMLVEGEVLRPGIITPSNCADFRNEGSESKRMKRIPHFITKAKNDWDWIRASSMNSSTSSDDGNTTTISKSDDASNDNSRRYEVFSSTNSIDPRNVIQGKVGNCGFCSIFASVVANWPEYIQYAFGMDSATCIHDCGAYSIQLFPHGKRRFLLLDDYILCHKNNVDDAAADGGDKMLYTSPSMHSLNENDLWIRLLEKAFVKLQGSIASLDGYYKLNSLYRHPGRALQLLTNASMALEVHYGRPEFNDDDTTNNDGTTIIDNTTEQEEEEVFNTLQLTQGVCARVAHCRQTIHGLHSNHGYSLLWIGEVNVRRKIKSSSSSSSSSSSMEHIQHRRLVCLRNPHGRGSYTGQDWGIDSSLWQEEEDVIQQLLIDNSCFMKCESTGRITWQRRMSSGTDVVVAANMPTTTIDPKRNTIDDDGIFFMSFSTFYNCFPIVTLVGPLSLSFCSDNSYHASSSIVEDDRLLLQQHDVPDCVHCVKGNLNCVREMIQKWL